MGLYAIRDNSELRVIERLKADIVEGRAHLYRSWLRSHQWVVVPVESASHFDHQQTQRLAAAFAAVGCARAFAIATEDIGDLAGPQVRGFPDTSCYLMETSPVDLWEFSELCSHFNFVLLPANRSLSVLCTVYDYYLVAGPLEFVRPAVGGDIEAAWAEFRDCAADPVWEGRLKTNVVRRYEDFAQVAR